METQPESQHQCATCRFFAPNQQLQGWGECQLRTLWPARSQPVKAEMHACFQQFEVSSWQPIQMRAAPAVRPGNPPRAGVTPRVVTPPQSAAIPSTATRPTWVPWGQWAAGVVLALSVLLAILDLTILLPVVPEWIWIWGPGIILSLLALFILSRVKE